MIEARELTKRDGDKTVVDRLSFTVGPGEVTGFLGPDGAGKPNLGKRQFFTWTPVSGRGEARRRRGRVG